MSSLGILSLGDNEIRELPPSISNLWMTLSRLFLGNNLIEALPFEEDELCVLDQGSVGQNPLGQKEEALHERWMWPSVAQQTAARILELFHAAEQTPSVKDASFLVDRGIHLAEHLDEPMIYELLFDGVVRQSDGTVQWNLAFDVGERVREAGQRLLPGITPGQAPTSGTPP